MTRKSAIRTSLDRFRRHRAGSSAESRPSIVVLLFLGIAPFLFFELVPLPVAGRFEWAVYDARMRMRNALWPKPIDSRVRVVGIGDADAERLDEDLHNRQSYMELVRLLRRWSAQSVTFDIFFVDQRPADDLVAMALSSMGPPVVLAYHFREVPTAFSPTGEIPEELAEFRALANAGTADVAVIASAIRQLDDYLGDLRRFEREQRGATEEEFSAGERQELRRRMAWVRQLRDDLMRRWLREQCGVPAEIPPGAAPWRAHDVRLLSPALMLAPQALGFANVEKGEAEVVRHAPLIYEWEGRLFPHLSLATMLLYYGVPFEEVEIDWGNALRFTPRRHRNAPIAIPIDERGDYLVNFREGEEFLQRNPTLSALLVPEYREAAGTHADPESFRDAIVLVGEVMSGGLATDIEPIPLQPRFPMVGLHANVIDNVLRGDFLHPVSRWARLGVILLLGTGLTVLYARLSFGRATALAATLLVVYTVGEFLLFSWRGLVFPVVSILAGGLTSGLGFFGYLVVVKERDRRLVRDVFLKSVSPRIGAEILRRYDDEAIWGARREITVLFVDLRGYTTLSETSDPADVLEVLDRFYDTASQAVFQYDGQVNKFLGDAVLALFGALPEEPANHAERAIRAAAEIQRRMHEMADGELMGRFEARIRTGAGVNTGEATVGLVGRSRIRIEYTALGDPVNIASRLQGLADEGQVMIGETTLEHCGDDVEKMLAATGLELGERESMTVKGRTEPVKARRAYLRSTATP